MFQNEFLLKSHSTVNFYFQINYSHCCTIFPCLNYILKVFCILDDKLTCPIKCAYFGIKSHVALDRNPGPG